MSEVGTKVTRPSAKNKVLWSFLKDVESLFNSWSLTCQQFDTLSNYYSL